MTNGPENRCLAIRILPTEPVSHLFLRLRRISFVLTGPEVHKRCISSPQNSQSDFAAADSGVHIPGMSPQPFEDALIIRVLLRWMSQALAGVPIRQFSC